MPTAPSASSSRVAAVIPAYNAERTLAATLDSILAQTLPVAEILVIDDGSQDRTREIVAACSGAHASPPIRLLQQSRGGPSAARNLGVRSSTAEFVAFLDADDAWEPGKIALQLAALEARPEAPLSYTGLQLVDPQGHPLEVTTAAPEAGIERALRLGNPSITPSCVMVRREAFERAGGFETTLTVGEDWELWVRLRTLGPFCAVDQPLTRYTVNNTGLSGNADQVYAAAEVLTERFLLRDLRGLKRSCWRRRILAFQAFQAGLTARAAGQRGKELRFLLRSFLLWPNPAWQPRRVKVLAVTLRDGLLPRRSSANASA